jgi:GTP-binding protein
MKITSAEFITSAAKPSQYPPAGLPEIAFSGRSNVGKSSLINTLANRKHLVKTSSTPGRTQLINFFDINKQICFVDLPGYGYARVPQSVKKTWGRMIESFLLKRKTLKGVVVIMDLRRTPGQGEMDLLNWLNHHTIASILVLTKADKLSKSRQAIQLGRIAQAFEKDTNEFVLFSAKSRLGRDALWNAILSLIGTAA